MSSLIEAISGQRSPHFVVVCRLSNYFVCLTIKMYQKHDTQSNKSDKHDNNTMNIITILWSSMALYNQIYWVTPDKGGGNILMFVWWNMIYFAENNYPWSSSYLSCQLLWFIDMAILQIWFKCNLWICFFFHD